MKYMLMDYVREAGWPELTKPSRNTGWEPIARTWEAMTRRRAEEQQRAVFLRRRQRPVRVVTESLRCSMGPMPIRKSSWVASISSRWRIWMRRFVAARSRPTPLAWLKCVRCGGDTARHDVSSMSREGMSCRGRGARVLLIYGEKGEGKKMRNWPVFNNVTLEWLLCRQQRDMRWPTGRARMRSSKRLSQRMRVVEAS